jgi:hypothetical protein
MNTFHNLIKVVALFSIILMAGNAHAFNVFFDPTPAVSLGSPVMVDLVVEGLDDDEVSGFDKIVEGVHCNLLKLFSF